MNFNHSFIDQTTHALYATLIEFSFHFIYLLNQFEKANLYQNQYCANVIFPTENTKVFFI